MLVTGGSGLLGVNWAMTVCDRMDVTLGLHQRKITLNSVDTQVLDLSSEDEIRAGLELTKPDIVVHAAGLTSVERCENYPDEARRLNVDLAENIAKACAKCDATLVHISSDHLYRGDRPNRKEPDETSPVNEYARTKLIAEERVIAACPDALIVRTNFFGWGTSYRHSFSDIIINSLRGEREIQLFRDVYYTPMLIEAAVESVHDLIAAGASGVLHVVGDERVSKYEFGLRLAREFGLNEALIKPVSINERADLIRRPLDMSLSNGRVQSILGRRLGKVQDYLARLKWQEQAGIARKIAEL